MRFLAGHPLPSNRHPPRPLPRSRTLTRTQRSGARHRNGVLETVHVRYWTLLMIVSERLSNRSASKQSTIEFPTTRMSTAGLSTTVGRNHDTENEDAFAIATNDDAAWPHGASACLGPVARLSARFP